MESIKKGIDKILIALNGTIIVLMVFLILWQICARYILQQPFTTGEESIRLLLIWLAICGGAYGFGSNSHLALDVLTSKLPSNKKIYLDICIHILILWFIIMILILGGIKMVLTTTQQVTPALQLPVSFLYLSLPVGGILSLFYEVYHIYLYIKKICKGV